MANEKLTVSGSRAKVGSMLATLMAARKANKAHYRSSEKGILDIDAAIPGRVGELLDEAVGLYEEAYRKLDADYARQMEADGIACTDIDRLPTS